ncbi:hypothetical protein HV346_06990 [Enterobacter sp. RHBSTW-00994]|uniref:hypothetical protein n=1 Tax=Enterobacter sp. RHBSTW-00994 TaxID=2742676 RepID=UPI0015E97AEE|nr:hypothetical protein [Enterobacter sp. RHBSTW-00994]QLR42431.1 hypothetical protein HV346_06990 [Enterobacter sp. RHBSTW-00994]
MKTKDRFNLSHVIGFFVGIVVTVIFNWIVFKDPKRITAPGVATLVAMCTFTLALWSASQVRKWLDNKINEKAFKQTEKILELIETSFESIDPLYKHIVRMLRCSEKSKHIDLGEYNRKKIIEGIDKMDQFSMNLTMATSMLKYWNVGLTEKGANAMNTLLDALDEIQKIISEIKPDSINLYDKLKLSHDKFDETVKVIRTLSSSHYYDIFTHDVTSHSKKIN